MEDTNYPLILADPSQTLPKVFVSVDVIRRLNKYKPRMCAAVTRGKLLAIHACDLMFLIVGWVMYHAIYARVRHFLSGLKDISDISHVAQSPSR